MQQNRMDPKYTPPIKKQNESQCKSIESEFAPTCSIYQQWSTMDPKYTQPIKAFLNKTESKKFVQPQPLCYAQKQWLTAFTSTANNQ
jgi:hypothetical protein